MKMVALVIAAVLDIALAVLLIGVSGFVIGGGPNAMAANTLTSVLYIGAVIACIALPIAAFIVNAKGKSGAAQFAAWLPAVAGFVVLVLPL